MDDVDAAIDGAIQAQVDGDMDVTFETDDWDEPSGLMKVWEMGDHRAELRYLTKPSSGEPMNSPWHVKVIGPDPLAGGRVEAIWSRSYDERDSAEGAAVGKLRDKYQRHQSRGKIGGEIDAAIAAKCGCSKPRGKDRGGGRERGQTIDADDFVSPTEECEPLLVLDINPSRDVDSPAGREEIEKHISETLGYRNRDMFTAIQTGPANYGNLVAVVKLPTAEVWQSINRKVERVVNRMESGGWIDDPGRDMSITLEGGDADIIAREFEEGFAR